MCAKDMVAQGTDDIEERITGFESREERARRPDRDLPLSMKRSRIMMPALLDYEVIRVQWRILLAVFYIHATNIFSFVG